MNTSTRGARAGSIAGAIRAHAAKRTWRRALARPFASAVMVAPAQLVLPEPMELIKP